MSALSKMLVTVVALLVTAGCGVHYAQQVNVADYPYRHGDFDYKYAWKTAATDQGVAIEGIMKNVRYAFIDNVRLTVNALDKNGKVVASATDLPFPQATREGETSRFALQLTGVTPSPGETYQFVVHYQGNEGGGGENGGSAIDWISMFKVDAMTGAVIQPPARNGDKW